MAIDPTIERQLEVLAAKIELAAGIDAGALTRDTTVAAKLRRISDAWDTFVANVEEHGLNDHTDVTLTGVAADEFLRNDGTSWLNQALTLAMLPAIALNDLSDVTIAGPSSGEVLRHDGLDWKNAALILSDLPAIAFDDLSDVSAGSPSQYEVVQWSGAGWAATMARLATSLADVTITPGVGNKLLVYKGSSGIWENKDNELNTLDDVVITGAFVGEFIRHNGSNWVDDIIALGDLPAIGIDDLDDAATSSEASRDLLQWNGAGDWVNRDLATCGLIDRDGTIALTGDWDAGAFDIEAQGLRATYDVDDVADSAGIFTVDVEDTTSAGGHLYRGLFVDIDYDFNNPGLALDTNLVRGLELDVDVTTTAVTASNLKPQLIRGVITNDASTAYDNASKENSPVSLIIQNIKTDQGFGKGAFNLSLEAGATSGICIGTRSNIEYAGSGLAIAYQGFAQGDTGATGAAVALSGFVSGQSGMASITAVNAEPQGAGTPPALDLVMAYKGANGHWLADRGSLFVTSTSRATPNAVPTTHLTPANLEGAGYFEGLLEVDGTLYADGDLDVVGDMKFTTANGGLPFGEIWVEGNTSTMAVSTTKAQVLDFDTDGQANQATPDHTNDHITIDVVGIYFISISASVANSAGAGHELHLEVYKNNGATALGNIHAHRTLGAGTDSGSITLSGIVSLAATDTLELWALSDSGTAKNITVEDCTMSVVQIGA